MPNKMRVKVEAVYRDELESFAAKVGRGRFMLPLLPVAPGRRSRLHPRVTRAAARPLTMTPFPPNLPGGREPAAAADGV